MVYLGTIKIPVKYPILFAELYLLEFPSLANYVDIPIFKTGFLQKTFLCNIIIVGTFGLLKFKQTTSPMRFGLGQYGWQQNGMTFQKVYNKRKDDNWLCAPKSYRLKAILTVELVLYFHLQQFTDHSQQ
ncbi:hypothetical protein Musp01_28520 [Muricauda sp. NBRC 101325]|nr:hypothetical protein Musp01_28520 [Muricauda sp. NBRC 101325]